MFWDRIAGVYDLFGNMYNGKVNREMCRMVSEEIKEFGRCAGMCLRNGND